LGIPLRVGLSVPSPRSHTRCGLSTTIPNAIPEALKWLPQIINEPDSLSAQPPEITQQPPARAFLTWHLALAIRENVLPGEFCLSQPARTFCRENFASRSSREHFAEGFVPSRPAVLLLTLEISPRDLLWYCCRMAISSRSLLLQCCLLVIRPGNLLWK
jgi:hypothetical protein